MTNIKPVWTRGFEANPAALSMAVVEGANGGHYLGRYTPSGQRIGQRYFPGPGSELEAHKAAELHNGPEADRAMYPGRYEA